MDSKYLIHIAKLDLRVTEYKILLVLLTKPYTATQVAKELGIRTQNKDRYFKKLRHYGLIDIDRIEGSNKFYKAITDIRKLQEVMPGQMKIS